MSQDWPASRPILLLDGAYEISFSVTSQLVVPRDSESPTQIDQTMVTESLEMLYLMKVIKTIGFSI